MICYNIKGDIMELKELNKNINELQEKLTNIGRSL